MISLFMMDTNLFLTKCKEELSNFYNFLNITIFRHYRVAKNANIKSRSYKFTRWKQIFRNLFSAVAENVFAVIFGGLFFYYVPYSWLALAVFLAFQGTNLVLILYATFPRDRTKLISYEYNVKFKNGDKKIITIWLPRYSAGYIGDPFLFDAQFEQNSRIKNYYYKRDEWDRYQ